MKTKYAETVMAKINCKECYGTGAIGTIRGKPVICRCVKVVNNTLTKKEERDSIH